MKKLGMIFCVMVQLVMIKGMDFRADMAQVKRMEILRTIRKGATIDMSLDSSSQTDDDMSCSSSLSSSRSSSGNFPIFRLKEVKQGSSPRQRESSKKFLQNLGVGQ
jgi:hypothetical protein